MAGNYQNKSSAARPSRRATATAPAKVPAKSGAKSGSKAPAKSGSKAPAKAGQAAVVVAKVEARAYDQFAAAAKLRGETPSQAIANFIARKPGKVSPRGGYSAAPARPAVR